MKTERDRLARVVAELNRTVAHHRGLNLELMRWETHTWPAAGSDAQAVINEQVGDYDIFIGILWKRFGTPTPRAASGTAEEFARAHESWREHGRPEIMFYFKTGGKMPRTTIELKEYGRVLAFKNQLKNKVLYSEFTSPIKFERAVREHLTQAVQNWGGDTVPFHAPLPPNYVVRRAALDRLVVMVVEGDRPVVLTAGMGGVGKSVLAEALTGEARVRRAFPDGVLWATLGEKPSRSDKLQNWAAALGHDLRNFPDVDGKSQRLRQILADKACLLVIDDAWEADHIAPLLVGGERCRTLITSREASTITYSTGAARYDLDEMTAPEALALLANATDCAPGELPGSAAQLARRVGYLPLALEIIGALVAKGASWEELRERFDTEQDPIDELRIEETETKRNSLRTAFELSRARLSARNQERYGLLGAFAAEAPFDEAAAGAVWGMQRPWRAIRRMASHALVNRVGGGRYALHALQRDHARGVAGLNIEEAEVRHAKHYLTVARAPPEEWRAIEANLGQIRAAWRWACEQGTENMFEFINALSDFLDYRGYWDEELEWNTEVLERVRTSEDRKNEAVSLQRLGWVHNRRGDYEAARKHYKASLAIFEEVGHYHGIAQDRHQLGILAQMQSDYDTAREHYKASLAINEELGDRAGIAKSRHQLGTLAQDQGDYDAAREHYAASLALKEELDDRSGIAATHHQLGILVQAQGNYNAAHEHYQASLVIKEELGDRSGIAQTRHQLGTLAQAQGNYDAAREHYAASLAIAKELGNRRGIASSRHQLGWLAQIQGNYVAAREHYEASLAIKEELGDRIGIASTHHQFGWLAQDQGDYAAAREHYTASLAIVEELGDRAGIAKSRHQLGTLAQFQSDDDAAREHYEASLAIAEELGMRANIASTCGQLGRLAEAGGELERAAERYQRALAIFEELGAPEAGMARRDLARVEARLAERAGEGANGGGE